MKHPTTRQLELPFPDPIVVAFTPAPTKGRAGRKRRGRRGRRSAAIIPFPTERADRAAFDRAVADRIAALERGDAGAASEALWAAAWHARDLATANGATVDRAKREGECYAHMIDLEARKRRGEDRDGETPPPSAA